MNDPQNAPDVFRGHADIVLWVNASPLIAPTGDLSFSESFALTVPEALRDQFDGSEEIQATWTPNEESEWSLLPGGRLYQWLQTHFQQNTMHLAPTGQPEKVHELTPVLFRCFQLEQGSLQLGGCTMEDRAVLCQTRTDASGQWSRHFYLADLAKLDEGQVQSLGLEHLEPSHVARGRTMMVDEVQAWGDKVNDLQAQRGEDTESTLVMQSVAWCKYAKGELTASGKADRLRLPFEGWAAEILSGKVKPPPYQDQATGDESYELVRLDDGRLTAVTAAAVCEGSNKRVLRTQLLKCPATGTQALKDFFSSCPVTGDQVFSEGMRPCSQCRQLVGVHCQNSHRICAACQQMKAAGPEDPRLARILGEHPGLTVWRRWRLSETEEVYILSAAALLRKLLVVLDKESLVPRHLAVRSRFSKTWATPSDLEQQELLAGR